MQKQNDHDFDSTWQLSSMTGLGRACTRSGDVSIEAVARAVNSRGLDIKCRMPHELHALEPKIHKMIAANFDRGRVEIDIKMQTAATHSSQFIIDDEAALAAHTKLSQLQSRFTTLAPITMGDILSVPGVMRSAEALDVLFVEELGEQAVGDALNDLAQARVHEGSLLRNVLKSMLDSSCILIQEIKAMSRPDATLRFQRFKTRLDDFSEKFGFDENRLYQEFALLVERSDFTEEIDRLEAHGKHFADLCMRGGAIGRKLDFLCQEMHRETNTLLSKAFESRITVKAIDLKAVIERIREQVQNIE